MKTLQNKLDITRIGRVCVLIMALTCGLCTHRFAMPALTASAAEITPPAPTNAGSAPPAASSPHKPTRGPTEPPANRPAAAKPDSGPLSLDTTSKASTNPRLEDFLDRLEIAESDGRRYLRNPRSSALGPFQFIASTWISVMRSDFPELSDGKTNTELLAMRTAPETARKAARAYVRKLSAALQSAGLKDTPVNLRIAFHFGPATAVRILSARDDTPIKNLVGRNALRANPYLIGLTLAGLKARATRRLSLEKGGDALGLAAEQRAGPSANRTPRVKVRCNLQRASCRRWLALERRKLRSKRAGQ